MTKNTEELGDGTIKKKKDKTNFRQQRRTILKQRQSEIHIKRVLPSGIYNVAIPHMGISLGAKKLETCGQVFTAALFIIVKHWKQPNTPLPANEQTAVRSHNGTRFSNRKEQVMAGCAHKPESQKRQGEC